MNMEFKPLLGKKWYLNDDEIIYKNKIIPISSISSVEMGNIPKNDSQNGGISIVYNGKKLYLTFPFKQSQEGIAAYEYLAKRTGTPVKHYEASEEAKKAAFHEYRMRCNLCGRVFCYTTDDLERNKKLKKDASISAVGSAFGGLFGSHLDMYALQNDAQKSIDKIVDYSKCPNCNSTDIVEMTKEEYQRAISQTNQVSNQNQNLSPVEEIKKYKELLDMGAITQEEFDAKKKQLLGL